MEEIREQPKKVKMIVIAVIAVVVIAAICFLSQWKALTWTGDYCTMCKGREPTCGKYCDICYEKVLNLRDSFETTP